MLSVIWLDRVRQGIPFEIHSNAGLDAIEKGDVAGIADGVRSNTERASVEPVEPRLDFRLPTEQLILIDQFNPSG